MDIAARVQEMLASFRQAGLEYLDHLSSTAAGSDEAIVRLKIVEPLLAALGYDLQADLDPEHRLKEGAIDILVRANGVPAMLWELKRTQETDLAQHEGQLTRYALAKGVVLNPRPFFDIWAIPYGDLIDASGFVTRQIGGYPTRKLKIQGQRLTFRQQSLSYFESDHPEVLAYLKLYIETNYDDLRARPVADLPRLIHVPKSPQAVRGFLRRLEEERMRVMLRWMLAVQREALMDEMAFDLYDVDDAQRDKLSGKLYTFDNVLASVAFVSILDNEGDNPMHRLAFPRDGVWHYRATEPLPHAVLLWRCPEFIEGMCDGRTVTTEWRAV